MLSESRKTRNATFGAMAVKFFPQEGDEPGDTWSLDKGDFG